LPAFRPRSPIEPDRLKVVQIGVQAALADERFAHLHDEGRNLRDDAIAPFAFEPPA